MLSYLIGAVIANLGMILPKTNCNILLQTTEEIESEHTQKSWQKWAIKPCPVILHPVTLNLKFYHGFPTEAPYTTSAVIFLGVPQLSHRCYCEQGLAWDSLHKATFSQYRSLGSWISMRSKLCCFFKIIIHVGKSPVKVNSWIIFIMEACKLCFPPFYRMGKKFLQPTSCDQKTYQVFCMDSYWCFSKMMKFAHLKSCTLKVPK